MANSFNLLFVKFIHEKCIIEKDVNSNQNDEKEPNKIYLNILDETLACPSLKLEFYYWLTKDQKMNIPLQVFEEMCGGTTGKLSNNNILRWLSVLGIFYNTGTAGKTVIHGLSFKETYYDSPTTQSDICEIQSQARILKMGRRFKVLKRDLHKEEEVQIKKYLENMEDQPTKKRQSEDVSRSDSVSITELKDKLIEEKEEKDNKLEFQPLKKIRLPVIKGTSTKLSTSLKHRIPKKIGNGLLKSIKCGIVNNNNSKHKYDLEEEQEEEAEIIIQFDDEERLDNQKEIKKNRQAKLMESLENVNYTELPKMIITKTCPYIHTDAENGNSIVDTKVVKIEYDYIEILDD